VPPDSDYHPVGLWAVLLIAPFISIGVALAAWTAAFFWFYACVIGDPEGADAEFHDRRSSFELSKKESNDGRASVLAVRAWWKSWLTKAIR
jgi:hypothetical protein